MNNELKIFENPEFGSIRTVEKNGEPWFVGKDVAEVLGYERANNAIRTHVDDEDKLMHQISASGQNRKGRQLEYAQENDHHHHHKRC